MIKQASVNGFEMAYREEGSGPPLLLVHGFPLDHTMWNPQIDEFKRAYRVIAPDLRGLGGSAGGAPRERFCTMEEYADDLAALLTLLSLDNVVLIGLSMGGYIAFAFYRKYPRLVRALVLADTRSESDTPEGKQNRYRLIEQVRLKGAEAAAEATIPLLLAPANYQTRPDIVAGLSTIIRHNHPAGIIAAAGALAERPDSASTLAGIKVPVLVITGKDDQITPAEGARKMAQAIPDWQLSIVPHAGHMSNLENPEFFNQAISSFLRGLKLAG